MGSHEKVMKIDGCTRVGTLLMVKCWSGVTSEVPWSIVLGSMAITVVISINHTELEICHSVLKFDMIQSFSVRLVLMKTVRYVTLL